MSQNIKVVVRCRPFNDREKTLQSPLCVGMDFQNQIELYENGVNSEEVKSFEVDRSYWSHDPSSPIFATQQTLMDELGHNMLRDIMNGFNCTMFVYGQTGAGKTYSMMGYDSDEGLLPLVCRELFVRITDVEKEKEDTKIVVTCRYLQIYNEKLSDLLFTPDGEDTTPPALKIVNSPKEGIIVQGATEEVTTSYSDIEALIEYGATLRYVASTAMNSTSSRSHTIFSIKTKIIDKSHDITSWTHMVDLAGSERQKKTESTGVRLKEGAAINKSLSCLARVINQLSKSGSNQGVSFRESTLTYILQDALSGNSVTVLVAAVSPALTNYAESYSTMLFVKSVKMIKLNPTKNLEQKPQSMLELRGQVSKLTKLLNLAGIDTDKPDQDLEALFKSKLEEMAETEREEQKQSSSERHAARSKTLEKMGITKVVNVDLPSLYNIAEDEQMSNKVRHEIGSCEILGCDSDKCTIVLPGLSKRGFLCCLRNLDNKSVSLSLAIPESHEHLFPRDEFSHLFEYEVNIQELKKKINNKIAKISINHMRLTNPFEKCFLHSGDLLELDHNLRFRINIPLETFVEKRDQSNWSTLVDRFRVIMLSLGYDGQDVTSFVETNERQHGLIKTLALLQRILSTSKLVEEANELTRLVRAKVKIRFEVKLVEFLNCGKLPDIVVLGIRQLSGLPLLRKVVRQNFSRSSFAQVCNSLITQEDCIAYCWTAVKFHEKLTQMRDCYEIFSLGVQDNFQDTLRDPWLEIDQLAVAETVAQLEKDKLELEKSLKEVTKELNSRTREYRDEIEIMRHKLFEVELENERLKTSDTEIIPSCSAKRHIERVRYATNSLQKLFEIREECLSEIKDRIILYGPEVV